MFAIETMMQQITNRCNKNGEAEATWAKIDCVFDNMNQVRSL